MPNSATLIRLSDYETDVKWSPCLYYILQAVFHVSESRVKETLDIILDKRASSEFIEGGILNHLEQLYAKVCHNTENVNIRRFKTTKWMQ